MNSYFETDVNCPSCFNDVLGALASTGGVDVVDGDVANGCIAVTHRVEESSLRSIITAVGRTLELACNGEYVMGEAHTTTMHQCAHDQPHGISHTDRSRTGVIQLDDTLAQIVSAYPSLARELERRGLDYCCGGAATLEQACAGQRLETETVIAELSALGVDEHPAAWSTMGVAALVDHIESTHHDYLWSELPRLAALFDKVIVAHGANHPDLAGARRCFDAIRADFEPHLAEEERVLFPMVRELSAEPGPPSDERGPIHGLISVMLREHDAVGDLLGELRTLTGGFETPPDGCASYAALFDGLESLEADTHLHIHKENNVLFPAVERLEDRSAS